MELRTRSAWLSFGLKRDADLITIHQCETELDFDTFVSMQFEAAMENSMVDLSKSHDEQLQSHRSELLNYIKSKRMTGIFIATDDSHNPVGYVWVSERGYQDPWDCQSDPAWIYDLRVDAGQRGKGIGQDLMLQAEAWAVRKQFGRIGLHVFGENQSAIALYTKLGYMTQNFQVQKTIIDSQPPNEVKDSRYAIYPFQPERDLDPLIELWKGNFITLMQSPNNAPIEQCQEHFEVFINKVKFNDPTVETFVVTDGNDKLSGFMRVTVVDYHGQQQAYIGSIQTLPDSDTSMIANLLLGYAERWAIEKGSQFIVTGTLPQAGSLSHFQKAGYQTSNLYMFKSLFEE